MKKEDFHLHKVIFNELPQLKENFGYDLEVNQSNNTYNLLIFQNITPNEKMTKSYLLKTEEKIDYRGNKYFIKHDEYLKMTMNLVGTTSFSKLKDKIKAQNKLFADFEKFLEEK